MKIPHQGENEDWEDDNKGNLKHLLKKEKLLLPVVQKLRYIEFLMN